MLDPVIRDRLAGKNLFARLPGGSAVASRRCRRELPIYNFIKQRPAAIAAVFAAGAFFLSAITAIGQEAPPVDTALVVSVDISNSVDDARYRLQMGGIAKALEDPGVIEAITGGSGGGILFSMVTWADTPSFVIPWVRIANRADSFAVAKRVRSLWRQGGEFTCMTRMLRSVNDKIVPQIPAKASRIIVDVSGDGPDNCNADETIEHVRNELVSNGVTINGLPICSIRRKIPRSCRKPFPVGRRLSSSGIASTSWRDPEVSCCPPRATVISKGPSGKSSSSR